ncbi:M15 family metallopeptidase [Microbacterium soli]|uniref:Peptidase M15B domain-containing protein n=1 Tax=Microbacterium soli TaxID=446075 RepID=A0ABP7NK33_9MICO
MQTSDLGHGRGWLRADAAASIRRVDARIGHPLQITDAGRTNAEQWEAWRKYGSPRAAYPGTSTHETGIAIDTDERIVGVLAEHGWYRPFDFEPWHFKYVPTNDRRRQDSTMPPLPKGKTMDDVRQMHWMKDSKTVGGRALFVPGTAWAVPWTESGATYANRFARGLDTGDTIEVTKSLFDAVLAASARCAPTALTIETVHADA